MFMVGIGASAGGIEALKILLNSLNEADSASYIIAQHISPTHVSMLGEILAKFTKLRIQAAADGVIPQQGVVYIIPPNFHLVIKDNALALVNASEQPSPKPSINKLFESLAENFGPNSMGIVLSGTGSDGASGLMSIRQAGGITIAQEPSTTEYASMPLSAIESGAADLVLPLTDIAMVIASASQLKSEVAENTSWSSKHEELVDLINKTANVDLSQYKKASLKRRIDRRMALHQIPTIEAYLIELRNNPKEIQNFIKDVFIKVTRFFRDENAITTLSTILQQRITQQTSPDVFRIWVAGCATGEEAYTLAIILEEIMRTENIDFRYQIFATDISEHALQIARNGVYARNIAQHMPKQYIRRYFSEFDTQYLVKKRLRDNILFSKHDLIKDPPFAKIDLVSCRNVLIYFNSDLQTQVLKVFNFSLKPEGLLFLGQSESISKQSELFQRFNAEERIFSKLEANTRFILNNCVKASSNILNYQANLAQLSQLQKFNTASKKQMFISSVTNAMVEKLMHNFFVINSDDSLIYCSPSCDKFLKKQSGFVSENIFDNLVESISLQLRSMLYKLNQRANLHAKEVEYKTLCLERENTIECYKLICFALKQSGQNIKVLVIQDIDPDTQSNSQELAALPERASDKNYVSLLNDELTSTRESLQTLIEELETINEELQSANEEMMSSNEELQATNEELQTSNEELQASNEELQTVNDELNVKNIALDQLYSRVRRMENAMKLPFIQTDDELYVEYVSETMNKLGIEHLPVTGSHLCSSSFLSFSQENLHKLRDVLGRMRADNSQFERKLALMLEQREFVITINRVIYTQHDYGFVLLFNDMTEAVNSQRESAKALHIASSTLKLLR